MPDMSSTAAPVVPPRPSRPQQAAAAAVPKIPEIPPRPVNKRLDRSVSPGHNYPHSPLYDMPSGSYLARGTSKDPSNPSLPPRPPSVSLPSIGQEGNEYAELQYEKQVPAAASSTAFAEQTRNVRGDLQLHAPKPSLPKASAKAQVRAVTSTDSRQAAALGLGKPGTPFHESNDDQEAPPLSASLRTKHSFSRPASSASAERRSSVVYGDEHGPAEQGGIRVPINPNLGDVQAPTPAPFGNDRHGNVGGDPTAKKRHHHRSKSGREILPPGSYGLHGHGVPAQDRFEQDWYAKHPDQLLHEEGSGTGHYAATGSGRGEFALSSEDLNQIVRETASRGAGFGTEMSRPWGVVRC